VETIDISQSSEIYTVSRLNQEARFLLEDHFQIIWIEGEVSNFAAPNSGHWYFSLKDPLSQVRCAMFKLNNRKLGFSLKDGMHVLVKARVSLYEGRGEFQLIVEHLEEAGLGKLRQEFEALKKRLSEAGLFDAAHKKELPEFPKTIGVVTSPTGAAIRDILSVLQRRFNCVPVIIYPTMVQGDAAAVNIVSAIKIANKRQECDVIILARGGGSLEDLWPFNEEIVARAIFQSDIPIISGVGHEIDFTIADFVADVRAPTPSAAAELVVPHCDELLESIQQEKRHLVRMMQQKILELKQQLVFTEKHLQQQHPKRKLTEQTQFLDRCEVAFIQLQNKMIQQFQGKLHTLQAELNGKTPRFKIRECVQRLEHDTKHLRNLVLHQLHQNQKSFGNLAAKLDVLSPLATLQRGFAIATLEKNHKILRRAEDVSKGDHLQLQLMNGKVRCEVI